MYRKLLNDRGHLFKFHFLSGVVIRVGAAIRHARMSACARVCVYEGPEKLS